MAKKLNERNPIDVQNEEGEEGEGTDSGTRGVEFHLDSSQYTRDDLLSSKDVERLVKVHNETHYGLVKKQKIERQSRLEIQEGKRQNLVNNYSLTNNGGSGINNNQSKPHPISQKAYFSGIDKQVIGLVDLNQAKTNENAQNELKDKLELQNQLKNRLQHTHTPKFNPRPRPT